jgi:hypothetical protein
MPLSDRNLEKFETRALDPEAPEQLWRSKPIVEGERPPAGRSPITHVVPNDFESVRQELHLRRPEREVAGERVDEYDRRPAALAEYMPLVHQYLTPTRKAQPKLSKLGVMAGRPDEASPYRAATHEVWAGIRAFTAERTARWSPSRMPGIGPRIPPAELAGRDRQRTTPSRI